MMGKRSGFPPHPAGLRNDSDASAIVRDIDALIRRIPLAGFRARPQKKEAAMAALHRAAGRGCGRWGMDLPRLRQILLSATAIGKVLVLQRRASEATDKIPLTGFSVRLTSLSLAMAERNTSRSLDSERDEGVRP